MSEIDFTSDKIFWLGWGLIYRAVCAPKKLTNQEISDYVTKIDPPGTSANIWVVAQPHERDDDFNGVNRLQCPDCEDRDHVLMNC